MTQTLSPQEDVIIIFPGGNILPGASPTLFCKVEPIGSFPVLRIEWDALTKSWKTDQVIQKEGALSEGNLGS